MNNLNKAIYDLVTALEETGEYIELKRAKSSINYNSQNGMRLKQFEQNQKRLSDKSIRPNEAEQLFKQLNDEYTYLSSIPEFKQYFAASERASGLISDVFNNINQNLNNKLR